MPPKSASTPPTAPLVPAVWTRPPEPKPDAAAPALAVVVPPLPLLLPLSPPPPAFTGPPPASRSDSPHAATPSEETNSAASKRMDSHSLDESPAAGIRFPAAQVLTADRELNVAARLGFLARRRLLAEHDHRRRLGELDPAGHGLEPELLDVLLCLRDVHTEQLGHVDVTGTARDLHGDGGALGATRVGFRRLRDDAAGRH